MAYEFRNLVLLSDSTLKAYHVEQTVRNEKVQQWIPMSVCSYKRVHPMDKENNIQNIDLSIEDWFVEKKDCKLII